MSGMRKLARQVAHSRAYRSRNMASFGYFFEKEWRDKGHPENIRKHASPGPTKKGHRPLLADPGKRGK